MRDHESYLHMYSPGRCTGHDYESFSTVLQAYRSIFRSCHHFFISVS